MMLIHGASLSYFSVRDYDIWHPALQTLALEAATMSQQRPTALICYRKEVLFKSTHFSFLRSYDDIKDQ